ncbi:porphobilinogen deaminase [[Candida] jaroonii]|uniref:Porphobilinogen deaminase n=1 Tax=[Candida] jaroonii TaxID=467808 RepID=A0ACA9Y9K3_9ASCO|nr:porphobilinogen deaminase [[Candida] jaroonii]
MEGIEEIRIGGRKSHLAIVQSEIVKDLIEKNYSQYKCSITALNTLADDNLDKALYTFGGKPVWTQELENLLTKDVGDFKQIDLIVHSLKDLPTNLPEDFELGAITKREDPRDAIIMKAGSTYKSLKDLPDGSVVGTSSIRRSAQLLEKYPNLKFESVRGNLETRLRKLDNDNKYECIILAAAGLIRIGADHRITKCLDSDEMFYSVGQGALGIEIRKNDHKIKEILSKVNHLSTSYRCLSERSLMRFLEGGCSVPLGVISEFNESTNDLKLKAKVVSVDGQQCVECELNKTITNNQDCEDLGVELGKKMIENGVKKILDEIDYENINQNPNRS